MDWVRDYQRRRGKVQADKDELFLAPEKFTLNTIFSIELKELKKPKQA